MVKVGFIGMGNIGNAILDEPLKTHKPEDMILSAARQDKVEVVTARTEVPHAGSSRECVEAVKHLILVVKPQYFDAVFLEVRDVITSEQMVISLVPGVTISNIIERLGRNVWAVRVMPNTPAMLGEGMTGISCKEGSRTEEEKETVRDVFPPRGWVGMVEERFVGAAGHVGDSLPVSVYIFIEALADGGVEYDLSRKTVYAMVAQIVLGNAKMILETRKHLEQLKDKACSPGGTTTTGILALEEHGLRSALIKVTDTCHEKTQSTKQDNSIKPRRRGGNRHGRQGKEYADTDGTVGLPV